MDVASTRYEPASLLNEPAPLGYKLFFALFPEPLDVERLYGASTRILSAHALRQTRQSVDRLHVTLCTVHDDMLGMPQQMINAAIAAGQKIQALRLPLRLDSAASFKKHGAFMLRADASTDAAVAGFRRPLMTVLRRFGMKPTESRNAHMSLVYRCEHEVKPHAIEPLCWTACRFVLVLSHVGRTRHEWLAAWPLSCR